MPWAAVVWPSLLPRKTFGCRLFAPLSAADGVVVAEYVAEEPQGQLCSMILLSTPMTLDLESRMVIRSSLMPLGRDPRSST